MDMRIECNNNVPSRLGPAVTAKLGDAISAEAGDAFGR